MIPAAFLTTERRAKVRYVLHVNGCIHFNEYDNWLVQCTCNPILILEATCSANLREEIRSAEWYEREKGKTFQGE